MNVTFHGLLNPDVNLIKSHQLFFYMKFYYENFPISILGVSRSQSNVVSYMYFRDPKQICGVVLPHESYQYFQVSTSLTLEFV